MAIPNIHQMMDHHLEKPDEALKKLLRTYARYVSRTDDGVVMTQ